MNQDGYFEEALKIPHALSLILPRLPPKNPDAERSFFGRKKPTHLPRPTVRWNIYGEATNPEYMWKDPRNLSRSSSRSSSRSKPALDEYNAQSELEQEAQLQQRAGDNTQEEVGWNSPNTSAYGSSPLKKERSRSGASGINGLGNGSPNTGSPGTGSPGIEASSGAVAADTDTRRLEDSFHLGSDGRTDTMRFSTASKKPLVVLGLREHVFTHSLSASAFFMSQQEYLFGTLWQRVMASPFKVRMHYGHPDLFDKVWITTRGSTAKASSIINISEDIFAGFTVMLRGGESGHVEFLQVGKGRDVGMLQIEVFESKISGGTAISMTSRDSFRITAGMDFPRLLSFYHSGGGFYISNVLIVVSLVCTVYYMFSLALTKLDIAILASEHVYLVGDLNFLQWFMQLGLLTVIPLFTLYFLEHGFLSALYKTIRMFTGLSPLFFMFEIQTKAYYFDAALTFGKQAYMATGRDFVFRHLSLDEIFRACAHSHLYLGMEITLLLCLITLYGSFASLGAYLFFFLTGWLFVISLLFAAFWFNPLALDWKSSMENWRQWNKWLSNPQGNADQSWNAWFHREVWFPYQQINVPGRIYRGLRYSRTLFPILLLLSRAAGKSNNLFLLFALFLGAAVGLIVGLQLVHAATFWCPTRPDTAPRYLCPFRRPVAKVLQIACTIGYFGVCLYVVPAILDLYPMTIESISCAFFALALSLAWSSRIIAISAVVPLADGCRVAHKLIDAGLGYFLLIMQSIACIFFPLGTTLHTRMLFSSEFSEVAQLVSGSKDALDRLSKDAGVKYLKLQTIQRPEVKKTTIDDPLKHDPAKQKPDNHVGAKRFRLKPVVTNANKWGNPSSSTSSQSSRTAITSDANVHAGTGLGASPGAASGGGSPGTNAAALGQIPEVEEESTAGTDQSTVGDTQVTTEDTATDPTSGLGGFGGFGGGLNMGGLNMGGLNMGGFSSQPQPAEDTSYASSAQNDTSQTSQSAGNSTPAAGNAPPVRPYVPRPPKTLEELKEEAREKAREAARRNPQDGSGGGGGGGDGSPGGDREEKKKKKKKKKDKKDKKSKKKTGRHRSDSDSDGGAGGDDDSSFASMRKRFEKGNAFKGK